MNCKVAAGGVWTLVVKRFAGPFWIRRRQLAKTQWLEKDKLEQLQLKLLKRIVRHSYYTVPYYKRTMDKLCISPDSIRRLDDIKRFPIISKNDVLQAEDTFVSTKYPRYMLRTAYTGGTTGTPMKIYRSPFSIQNEHAFVRRQWDWAGISLRDRCAYLTGRLIVKPDDTNGPLHAYDPAMKELILSTYHLSTDTAKRYAELIRDYNVKAVVAYPSAVYLLARTCLDYGIKLKLRSVLTSSETLTESMHNTISEAFGCAVFDFYGGAERVCYIHTCEKGSYHIIPEYGLTELIPLNSQTDGACRIIATGFWNMAMPLIRYDLGDIVVRSDESCLCGRAFPVIKSIKGREADVIRTLSGRAFGAAILTHLLYGTNHIVESQIRQDAVEHITIEYVPARNFCQKDIADFQRLIDRHLPGELRVDLKQVAAVQRTAGGKIRPLVSQLH